MSPKAIGLLLAGLMVLTAGCKVSTDDELAPPPTKTITASPSQSIDPAPATIPVGHGDVSPADVVWAQGSVLHVGRRQVDLSPTHIDAFVVVEGGVFVLAGGELWFTDLARVRGTGQTDVTHVRLSSDASHLAVVDTRSGQPLEQGYDTRSGRAVRGQVDTQSPEEVRAGPGRYEVRTSTGRSSVVDTSTGKPVRVVGLPSTFTLGGWSGDSAFYGLGGSGAHRSVVGCDLVRHRCTVKGPVDAPGPVVFGTGR